MAKISILFATPVAPIIWTPRIFLELKSAIRDIVISFAPGIAFACELNVSITLTALNPKSVASFNPIPVFAIRCV